MKILITKADILWNYIGTLVSLCGNFLLLPFLLHFLSTSYYGLWNIFISLGAISVLFDFGFNSLFSRNVSYAWSGVNELSKENVKIVNKVDTINYPLLKRVIKTCQIIYWIISSTALIVLSTIGSAYIVRVTHDIKNTKVVLTAWLLFAIGIFLDLLYGYFDAFLRGIGEVAADNKARVISKLVQIFLTITMLFFGVGILSTSIGNIIYGLIFRGICKRKFYSVGNLKEKLRTVGSVTNKDVWDVFNVVWHNAWREGVVSFANYISNQVTTLLCSFYLGLSVTASFGLAVQCTSAIAQIASSQFSSYMPSLQGAYAQGNTTQIKEQLSYGIGLYILLFPIGLTCLVLLIPIVNFIKGGSILNIGIVLGVGVYQYLLKFRDCYAIYLGGTNRVIYYKSFICASILCVILSIMFVHYLKLGVYGFVIAQILSQLIHNSWYWPKFVNNELKLSTNELFKLFKRQFIRTIGGIF